MSDRDLIARLAHALRVQLDGVDLYSELLAEADAHQGKPGGGAMSDRLRELFDKHADTLSHGDGTELCMSEEAFAAAARALLAEAQPQPGAVPTQQELEDLAYTFGREYDEWRLMNELDAAAYARAVLARWGRPAPEPVSVATDAAWREFIEAVQHAQHVAVREGESPRFDLVATAFALWRSAAPEPVSVAERLRLVAAGIRCGYMAGHDATVEGRYADPEEVAAECATQVLQEQADE